MSWPTSEPPLLAVFGRPVAHSRSPHIFSVLFRAAEIPGHYLRIRVDGADRMLRMAEQLGLRGFNVTAPLKRTVMPLLDGLDEAARRIGAVNAVYRKDSGWRGANTDHIGVVNALQEGGADPRDRTALVLGAGGAGRAAAFGLANSGARRVTLINRTPEHALEAARALGCRTAPWSDFGREAAAADILVSCLPAGVLPPGTDGIPRDAIVLDAEYGRGEMASAFRNRGGRAIDGREWLFHQALPAFTLFTGRPSPDSAAPLLRDTIYAPPPSRKTHLALIGFMGAGKSSIGRILAERGRLRLVDTDRAIERESGRSIPDIFSTRGESGFREMEADLVRRELARPHPALFALGGGAVLDGDNRALIREKCRVIWLWIPADRAVGRIDPGTRPLLSPGEENEETARRLLTQRIPLYAALSDLVVDTETSDITPIAERIAHEMDIPLYD